MTHQSGAARQVHHLALEADQAARRDAVLEADAAASIGGHVLQVATPIAQRLHDCALVRFLDVEGQHFIGLALLAFDFLENHPWTADRQLVTLAAHGFKENRQVQLAAPGNQKTVGVCRFFDAQRHVGQQLLAQSLADLPAGDELAFSTGVGRVVDHESHVQRRLVDLQHRQRFGSLDIGDRAADRQVVDAGDQHDVAGQCFVHRYPFQPLEAEDLADLGRLRRAMLELAGGIGLAIHDDHLLGRLQASALNAADADASDVARVIQRRDLQLQRPVDLVGVRRRNMLEDGVEHRPHVRRGLGQVECRIAVDRRRVDHREIELLVIGTEFVEQVESVIDDPVRPGTVAVDLVHHDDRLQTEGQRLLGDEARLRHRPFNGIDQQQDAIDHRQHSFHFAAEVGVPRRVDDVDMHAQIVYRQILGQDRDPALFLEVVRVHHPFGDVLVGRESAGLDQQLVDQGGLAVVDVGNDGDVTDGAGHRGSSLSGRASSLAQDAVPAALQKGRDGSGGLIAREIGGAVERRQQLFARGLVNTDRLHGQKHARDPLITLGFTDGKGHVTAAQHRMADFYPQRLLLCRGFSSDILLGEEALGAAPGCGDRNAAAQHKVLTTPFGLIQYILVASQQFDSGGFA
ncbi:hypothetical protein ACCAA_600035 [Candidatus Accumulibacter aalborgensis]|uniref:Uncharacterized protein n=1 Tax=Candidatus Accumulibacter aalborgensis TaxID=1860102 RepID=A0A1A8XXC7_9PROT|nr:hypothetical protein ACCAA_600035 [Candidatus Accumulibacter aalborgensis]